MAMLDALELNKSLADPSFDTVQAALASYEQRMFKRFAAAGEHTMFNTRWMHEPNALENMLKMFGGDDIQYE